VAKPKFSWEVYEETYSLILKVTNGDRETTWRIGPRPNATKLADLFLEIVGELDQVPADVAGRPLRASEKPVQVPDVPEDTQMTEEDSAELRAAKARSVVRTGVPWHSNMEQDEVLPLYEIGHNE
jgi:hypothetical protein